MTSLSVSSLAAKANDAGSIPAKGKRKFEQLEGETVAPRQQRNLRMKLSEISWMEPEVEEKDFDGFLECDVCNKTIKMTSMMAHVASKKHRQNKKIQRLEGEIKDLKEKVENLQEQPGLVKQLNELSI
jgi:hypothetical protein